MRWRICILLILLFRPCAAEVRVHVLGNESMPFNGVENGRACGILVDILNEVSAQGEVAFTFELGLPWLRAQYMAKRPSDRLVAIIPLSRTVERESQYKWIAALLPNEQRIFTLRQGPALARAEDARSLNVGVIPGYAFLPDLRALGFTRIDQGAQGAQAMLKKLAAARLDAVVDSAWVVRYHWSRMGKDAGDLIMGPRIGEAAPLYIAASPAFPDDVAASIAKGVRKMKADGRMDRLLRRWADRLASASGACE